MAPGNLVVSAYVTVPDITVKATPDLKLPGSGHLLHVDLGAGQRRLGGSSLAQVFGQVCGVWGCTFGWKRGGVGGGGGTAVTLYQFIAGMTVVGEGSLI